MRILYTVMIISLLTGGCKKYLDKKSDQSLSVPDNLDDLELLLNNVNDINVGQAAGNAASDEYYLKSNDWETQDLFNRDTYVWDPQTEANIDWNKYYNIIFTVNTVLENLEKVDRTAEPVKWDQLKGWALFVRGISYFQLAQIYSPPYTGTENSVYGLPLRLSSDFNKPVSRASLKETWEQLISDIQTSIPLLPKTALYKTQASKWAAFALLARIYLLMGNYQKAYDLSDSSLQISNSLIDFNTIDENQQFPFSRFNPEVIYHMGTNSPALGFYWQARVDSVLYKSFSADDRRKKLFFIDNGDGTFSFKGNYTGSSLLFNGLSTSEMYLIRAEAAVRTGNIQQALKDINALLKSRWVTAKYNEVKITNPEELLKLILDERKKDLMYKGQRWSDLRRLNTDPRFQETLKRIVNGQVYELPPNDPRYVFLIPIRSVNISGIQQNPR